MGQHLKINSKIKHVFSLEHCNWIVNTYIGEVAPENLVRVTAVAEGIETPYAIYHSDCIKNEAAGLDMNATRDTKEKYRKIIMPELLKYVQTIYENGGFSRKESEEIVDSILNVTIRN